MRHTASRATDFNMNLGYRIPSSAKCVPSRNYLPRGGALGRHMSIARGTGCTEDMAGAEGRAWETGEGVGKGFKQ
jgi:hypothetical protein